MRGVLFIAIGVAVCVFAALVLFPQIDLAVSGLFGGADGFAYARSWPILSLASIARYGSRVMGGVFLVACAVAAVRRRRVLGVSGRAWLFLFVALVVGPGLVANTLFKDNWGRARPRDIVAFGGTAAYSPPLLMSDACVKNCSFVSGDGAFGFFLPTIAYVAPKRRSRGYFWGGLVAGCVFGGARIAGGAHFFSDVVFAAFFMLLTSFLLHGLFMGRRETFVRWRLFFGRRSDYCSI